MKPYSHGASSREAATRAKLALFGRQSVSDIVDYVSANGRGVIAEVFDEKRALDPNHVLSLLDPEYVPYEHQPSIIKGLEVIIMSNLRKPSYGNDEYVAIIQGAYGLPLALATYYAGKIETFDKIITDLDGDGKNSVTNYLAAAAAQLTEGARSLVNGLSSAVGMSNYVNWDEGQQYDIDFLDEVAKLGDVCADLERRSVLMKAQSLVAASLGMFKGLPTASQAGQGDVEDGDPYDAVIGDLCYGEALRSLPCHNISEHAKAFHHKVKKLRHEGFRHALASKGISHAPGVGLVNSGDPDDSDFIDSLVSGDVETGDLGSILASIIPGGGIIRGILSSKILPMLAGKEAAHAATSSQYGDAYGDAMETGDLEEVLKLAFNDISDAGDVEEGDIEDGDIMEMINEGDLTPEAGGLFGRWRKQAAHRVERRNAHKEQKFQRRERQREQRFARRHRDEDSSRNEDEDSPRPMSPRDYPQPDDQGGDESENDGGLSAMNDMA